MAMVALTAAACGSSSATSTSTSSTTSSGTAHLVAGGVVGKRYCEVLLVHLGTGGLVADVYNTYPLNACPEAQWAAEDATAIAKENGVLGAQLNGPRFWLMNSIAHTRTGSQVVKSFGGMAMNMYATVVIGTSIAAAKAPYTTHTVSRQASFTFNAGRQVYELSASIKPGDSGSPLVVAGGHVLGVVFSRSTVATGVGYALTAAAVTPTIERAVSLTRRVSTGACTPG